MDNTESRISISVKEGRFEISGSEEFVSTQIENFKELITETVKTASERASTKKPSSGTHEPSTKNNESKTAGNAAESIDLEANTNGDYEISYTELHMRTRKFIDDNDISINVINSLYYKEDGEVKPLYEDIKCNQFSECQLRLAFLSSFENALYTGDFTFDVENVRQRCKDKKCYDKTNYLKNFRNNSQYFDNFDDYKTEDVKISLEGKDSLASIIKDIAS